MRFPGSTIAITREDKVVLKPVYKYPVPTNVEVKTFFDTLGEIDPQLTFLFALAFMSYFALRPTEVPRMIWPKLFWNEDRQEISKIRHLFYKPTAIKRSVGRTYFFKELEKPNHSKWFSDLVKRYANIHPKYANQHVFSFNYGDSITKLFTRLRKKVRGGELPQLKFLLDELNTEVFRGLGHTSGKRSYRVHPYSFRRFCLTFLYWSKPEVGGFDQDAVALCKTYGHTKIQTLLDHYVFPKETIGLTQEMIDKRVSMDEFIQAKGAAGQILLQEYTMPKKSFTKAGQTTLDNF